MTLVYVLFWISVVILGWALYRISHAQKDTDILAWGLILIGVGLFSVLFSHGDDAKILVSDQTNDAELFRTYFVILAGIGANIVASSAVANFKPGTTPQASGDGSSRAGSSASIPWFRGRTIRITLESSDQPSQSPAQDQTQRCTDDKAQ